MKLAGVDYHKKAGCFSRIAGMLSPRSGWYFEFLVGGMLQTRDPAEVSGYPLKCPMDGSISHSGTAG